jgi:ankyrin repeat protein
MLPSFHSFLDDVYVGINAIDKWGQTPLMIAAIEQKNAELAALLNTRRPSVDINKAKHSGATALFYAVQHSPAMIVQALLRRGADPNMSMKSPSSLGNTPLHFACLLEKHKHAELLLEYGANPHALNQYGQKPLQLLPANMVRSTRLYFQKLFEVRSPTLDG